MRDFNTIINTGVAFLDSLKVNKYYLCSFSVDNIRDAFQEYKKMCSEHYKRKNGETDVNSISDFFDCLEKMQDKQVIIMKQQSEEIRKDIIRILLPNNSIFTCEVHDKILKYEELFLMLFFSFKNESEHLPDAFDTGLDKIRQHLLSSHSSLKFSIKLNDMIDKIIYKRLCECVKNCVDADAFDAIFDIISRQEPITVQINETKDRNIVKITLSYCGALVVTENIRCDDTRLCYRDFIYITLFSLLDLDKEEQNISPKDTKETQEWKEEKKASEQEIQAKENMEVFNALCILKECCARHLRDGDCSGGCPFDMGNHCALMRREDVPKEWPTVHPEKYVAFRN